MQRYRVVAGYFTAPTAIGAGRASVDIARGDLVPADVPTEDIDRGLRLGQIEPVDVADAQAPQQQVSDDDTDPPAGGEEDDGDPGDGEQLDADGADEVVVEEPEPEATPARATTPRKRTAK